MTMIPAANSLRIISVTDPFTPIVRFLVFSIFTLMTNPDMYAI